MMSGADGRHLLAFSSSGRGTPWRWPVYPVPRRVRFRDFDAAALYVSELTAGYHRTRPPVGLSPGVLVPLRCAMVRKSSVRTT